MEAGARNAVQLAIAAVMLVLLTRTGTDFAIYLLIIGLILVLSTSRGILPLIFASPPMMLAGRLSLGIYLVHYKALGLFGFLGQRLGRMSSAVAVNDVIATIVSGLAVIGVAWLLHILIERPGRIAIRNLQARRRRGEHGTSPLTAEPSV